MGALGFNFPNAVAEGCDELAHTHGPRIALWPNCCFPKLEGTVPGVVGHINWPLAILSGGLLHWKDGIDLVQPLGQDGGLPKKLRMALSRVAATCRLSFKGAWGATLTPARMVVMVPIRRALCCAMLSAKLASSALPFAGGATAKLRTALPMLPKTC